ncbi:MAG: PLP-dependent aminotransferase family protein [Hyphomicrobiales bacterium]|nr:PLP-dependent aminotransferase family protein [Hyphomicrobiales bacterium]
MTQSATTVSRPSDQLPITIDKTAPQTLQLQIFTGIQQLILQGHLRPNEMLPPFRELASQLQVSKNTVILAYQRLISEGYVDTKPGVGTFVTQTLPERALHIHQIAANRQEKDELLARRHPLLFHGRLHEIFALARPRPEIDFFVGRPDADTFPRKTWARILTDKLTRDSGGMTQYSNPAGLPELRMAIANHLAPARGIKADPDQIIIVGGIQEALSLLARILVASETRVAIESPCYQGAAYVLKAARAEIVPVRVDETGLDVDALPDGPVSVIYVTPSHQYPLGGTLSLERRLKLLEWAWDTGAYIIEDDYDSDFRYDGPPLFALAGLDRHESVIYLGTFSKSIGAGIRLGYIVAPPALVKPLTALKGLLNNGNPWLEQAVLAEFLESGAFNRHLRKIRKLYLSRRNILIDALQEHFGDVAVTGAEGGMHVTWALPPETPNAAAVAALAREKGVGIYPLERGASSFVAQRRQYDRMIMLGFSSVLEENIRRGIGLVAQAVSEKADSAAGDYEI